MKFQLVDDDGRGNKTGTHRVGSVVYSAGDVLESFLPLDVLFRNKFVRVPDNTEVSEGHKTILTMPPATKTKTPPSELEEKAVQELTTPTAVSIPNKDTIKMGLVTKFGEDKTDDFPDAKLLNVHVYFSDVTGRYTVVDLSDEIIPVVLKDTKSEKNLLRFLEKQLG